MWGGESFFCHVIKSRKVKFDWSMLRLRAPHYTVFMPLQVKDEIFCKIGKAGEPKTSYLVMFWRCKPPHSAFHIYLGCRWGVSAPSHAVEWAYGCTTTKLHHCGGGDPIGKIGGKGEPEWHQGIMFWGINTSPHCISHLYWMYMKCLSAWICFWQACECTLTQICLCRLGPKLGKLRATLHLISILDVYNAFEHLHMLQLWMPI